MSQVTETDRPPIPPSPASAGPARLWPALLAVLLVVAAQPRTWGLSDRVFAPEAGVGLALTAWFGLPAGLLVLAGAVLSFLPASLVSGPPGPEALSGPLLAVAEALGGWWVYHRVARGARGLADPRSAVCFLLSAPFLTAGLSALVRVLLGEGDGSEPLVGRLAGLWLGRALGMLVAAPPLLAAVTPFLVRRGLARPEVVAGGPVLQRDHVSDLAVTWGDWVEIAGLAVGGGVFGLLLSLVPARHGWEAWAAPVFVIVWASLRQGLRGGTLVAAASAALPLFVLRPQGEALGLAQSNLVVQCAVALLVSATVTWLRLSEARYRRVIGHVPVVLYSARVRAGSLAGRLPEAEITLVSAASDELIGCPPELLLGEYRHWLRRVHPDDHEILRAALTQLGRQAQPVTCEYRLTPRAGDPLDIGSGWPGVPGQPLKPRCRWVRDVMAPRQAADGRLDGWEGVVTDITEQRALADDLRRTSSMFHALVTHLPTGVFFVHGPTGRPILVNARARHLLGQREDASADLEHLSLVYRLHRPDGSLYPTEELPVYQALRRGVSGMRDDIVVHRPDGRRIPLVTWAAPVHLSGQATPDAAVWVLEDLTALHQAEAARRDTEGRLRTVVETIGEGLIVQDRRFVIVDCNAAACAILGETPDRLRGRTLIDLAWTYLDENGTPLTADDLPARVALQTGRPLRHFVLGLAPAGEAGPGAVPVRWVLTNAMPLGPGPTPGGVVVTFTDITAYRHAQEVLRASEEKYRGLVEQLPLMLIQVDRNLRMVYANPATRQVTGFEMHEIADPAAWQAITHPEDLPKTRRLLHDALAGVPGREEIRYRAKDGSDRAAFMMSHPRRLGGEIIGVTSLLLDVTRERRLEHELQRAQRLELVGRLSSGIAHDFNNLLSVVLTLSELARGTLPHEHPAFADLLRISQAGEQAASLAAQLLAFSKNRRHATRRVEVNAVVRRTLGLLRGTLPPGVRVEADLAGKDLFVLGDETQLQQILMNLCLNARDAMPQGGRLRVRTETPDDGPVEEEAGTGWLRLSVEDDGHGMSRQVLEHIFDPFFSTKERGTGLGLAVVQQIAESGGGRVEAESEPGHGSRFRVWLPLAPAVRPVVNGREAGAHSETVS